MNLNETTASLWKNYHNNPQENNLNKLIEHYLPFVKKIAVRYAEKYNWYVQPDELQSFGVDGLYNAIENFDESAGVKFESFANQRVKGAMIDGLRRQDHIPRSVRVANDQFERHKQRVQDYCGYKISDSEFVQIIGMNSSKFNKHFNRYIPSAVSSLEGSMDYENQEEMQQDCNIVLADNKSVSPESRIRQYEFFKKILYGNCFPLEQQIIFYYYYKSYTMGRIAEILNLSESRISQLHKEILEKLKKKIEKNPELYQDIIEDGVENSDSGSDRIEVIQY